MFLAVGSLTYIHAQINTSCAPVLIYVFSIKLTRGKAHTRFNCSNQEVTHITPIDVIWLPLDIRRSEKCCL